MQSKKILWIEDDATILRGLVRPLEKGGYNITEVKSEKEALDVLGKESFDLILFDIIIPSGSSREEDYLEFVGVRLADEIVLRRKIRTPIIAISVVNRPEILQHLKDLGFVKILSKGYVLPSELKKEVDTILHK